MRGINKSEKNGMWKGDNVGYAALHYWVRKRIPKPLLCNLCVNKKAVDLANRGVYSRDLAQWEWLCRKCHMTKDGRLEKLRSREVREKAENSFRKTCAGKPKRTREQILEYGRRYRKGNKQLSTLDAK